MKGSVWSKLSLIAVIVITATTLALPVAVSIARPQVAAAAARTNPHPLCSKIGTTIWASTALRMWCSPPHPGGSTKGKISNTRTFGSNVNAADPAEDVSPSGVRGYGQSETSIASVGRYVVEAWNDVTSFVTSTCPSALNKEEATGYGFSANGGASFVDEGGLPNANCHTALLSGDPGVEAWSSGGSAYFYISSLYFPVFSSSGPPSDFRAFVAVNACQASGTGSAAVLSCGQPVIVAASTQCVTFKGGGGFCSFLDKPYLSIDPQRGRLYVSYTEFGLKPPPDNLAYGQIELAACDIGTPTGGTGSIGGTAGHPVCEAGGVGSPTHPGSPYYVVAPGPECENQGSYPAVDAATGDVYVAYEFNLGTDAFVSGCNALPTQNVVKRVPLSCLSLPVSCHKSPVASNGVSVVTMFAAAVPGYTRFPLQDFPRIAVSDQAGTVSIVWNDAGQHPLGDILLQSFALGSLTGIQSQPVRLNSHATGGLHFLPALRNSNQNGNLSVSWYERSSPTTTLTNVVAALNLDPRVTDTPASNVVVTTAATDWLKVTEFPFFPNFGDYTDNYVAAGTLYAAWSDGRTGIPQPFEAHAKTT